MRPHLKLIIAGSFLVLGSHAIAAPPVDPAQPDPGETAWHVFADKCAECHHPSSAGRKTTFRYVLDLQRVAGNPRLVVPYEPDRSRLWRMVRDGDMPPDDARFGPLSAGQKQAIHDWIASGASAPLGQAASRVAPAMAVGYAAPSFPVHAMHWLGKLHVLVIHFPIALFAAAALAESWALLRRSAQPSAVVRYCVALAAGGAVVAAVLGWSRVSFGGYDAGPAATLNLHRWLGTLAGVLGDRSRSRQRAGCPLQRPHLAVPGHAVWLRDARRSSRPFRRSTCAGAGLFLVVKGPSSQFLFTLYQAPWTLNRTHTHETQDCICIGYFHGCAAFSPLMCEKIRRHGRRMVLAEWKTPSAASERKNPVPPDRQSTTAGRAIYERRMPSCHGSGGKGDGKDGMDLNTRPADLSSPGVAGQSDGALFWKVTMGRRPMPGFRKDLTDEERWHVVNFIRTLTNRR